MRRSSTLTLLALLSVAAIGCGDDISETDSLLYFHTIERIGEEFASQTVLTGDVTCPTIRAGEPGTYACTATVDDDTTSWIATITQDTDGRDQIDVSQVR